MASTRKLFAAAAVLVAGATGYYLYSAFALQGQGTLAQAPLNIQSSVAPAFMMAVDDSGSMTFQTQFPGADGQACWDGSFYDGANLRTTAGNGACNYNYIFPHPGYTIDTNRSAVPPLDRFGFARSPETNPTYFNPSASVEYAPWLNSDNTPYTSDNTDEFGNADITATRADPRNASPLIDFTSARAVSDQTFRVRNGMVLPSGTKYYLAGGNSCGGMGTSKDTRNTWVTLGADLTVNGTCSIGIEYFPAVVFLRTTTARPAGFKDKLVDPGVDGGYSLAKDACGPGCDMYRYDIKSANYDTTEAYDAAIQKFANWFSYYGNRNRAMIAGMTRSMIEVNNMRVGYFTINQHNNFDDPINDEDERVTMYNMANPTERGNLFTKLLALPASGSTPNRQAVAAASKQFTRTDGDAPVKLVCQKNAAMLFTDGYSNQDGPTVGNTDSGMGAPFKDDNSNTMADIVTKYYLDDGGKSPLRPDLLPAGKVPVAENACDATTPDPKIDCQTNLHMNFYGVTLGARGKLYDPDIKQDAYSNAAIYNNWPSRQNDNPTTVDDIWHAAVNTRGEYVNARTPADIISAMRRILQQVGGGSTPSGSIALTGSRVGTGSLTVVPFYESTNNGTDWYSTLTGSTVTSNVATGEVKFKDEWEAAEKLPAAAARNIWFGTTASSVVPTVAQFTAANLGAEPLTRLCDNPSTLSRCSKALFGQKLSGVSVDQVVSYLRGDTTLELKKAGGKLRDRTTRLGDIVNSSPIVSSPAIDDYGYVNLRGSKITDFNPYDYDDYIAKKANRDPVVYAGANDGMLHAFDGKTGVEKFAYIPATAVGHMGNLAFPYNPVDKNDQTFSHRYYVDGLITVSDAHYKSGWQTVLVGAAGAGGRGVFALNVSDPGKFSNKDVLWEVNDKVDDPAIKNNIGYVLGKPVIVPVKVGSDVRWKAIFGNGYGSVSGKAALFVVDIETGAVKVTQAIEATGPATSNGLGNIIAIDRYLGSDDDVGRDGYADTVYGGDQNGAVWKFDLREDTPVVGVDGEPLFIAINDDDERQPIIGGFEAASGPSGGVMLYFGTGSFSFENDPGDHTMQSVYGVLDTFTEEPVSGRSELLKQEVTLDGEGVRTTTKATGLGKLGWYMDLGLSGTSSGERFVGNPVIASGVVFFPTYDPSSTADCGSSGNNWLYGLNALTGGAGLSGVHIATPDGKTYGDGAGAVELNTQGTAPVKDVAVMTTPRQGMLPLNPDPDDVKDALDSRCTMAVKAAGADPLYLPRPCGRQSWRQIQ